MRGRGGVGRGKEGGREKSSKTRAHQREQFFSFPVTFCSLTEETGGDRSPHVEEGCSSSRGALEEKGTWVFPAALRQVLSQKGRCSFPRCGPLGQVPAAASSKVLTGLGVLSNC